MRKKQVWEELRLLEKEASLGRVETAGKEASLGRELRLPEKEASLGRVETAEKGTRFGKS